VTKFKGADVQVLLWAPGPRPFLRFRDRCSGSEEDEMAMAQVHPDGVAHRTNDLHLAAALLATGHHLVTTTRDGSRVPFHFMGPEVDGTVMQYTNGNLQVDVCRFVHALDRLRTLVAHTRS
jgi:hypothetical protein